MSQATRTKRRKQFDTREVAAILAGLRLLQENQHRLPERIEDIYTNSGEIDDPLDLAEIDVLCERINLGDY
jgi:hypothetical protein